MKTILLIIAIIFTTFSSSFCQGNDLLEGRKNVATVMELKLLDRGFDSQVYLSKKDNSVLYVSTRLMNRPLAYRFYNSLTSDYYDMETLVDLGFKKVVFTDGSNFTQQFSIEK
ncbi:hypothetical protein HXX01_04970 [Candidatus Nomurabacteria bacterium]|nr:hypothetical protein [Candidatus Nomurabacteria bacterium]